MWSRRQWVSAALQVLWWLVEEWRVFHPSSEHKLLTTESSVTEKHLHSSILLNQNESSWDCTNARRVFWPTITGLRGNEQSSCFLLSSPVCDLSLVFNPVTCKILDHDSRPASPFREKYSILSFCKQNKLQSRSWRMPLQGFAQRNLNYWSKLKF